MKLQGKCALFGLLVLMSCGLSLAQNKKVEGNYCAEPTLTAPGSGYKSGDKPEQPDKTADLPSVVQSVEQAVKCYQALSGGIDPMQPNGLPKLSGATLDFKTTTGKTIGLSFFTIYFQSRWEPREGCHRRRIVYI
jgi:hypothetical protein